VLRRGALQRSARPLSAPAHRSDTFAMSGMHPFSLFTQFVGQLEHVCKLFLI
jgi:hypothetical protein